MICTSITQTSRRLAQADMQDAARQCDLLEVQVDRFGKAPEVGGIAGISTTLSRCTLPSDVTRPTWPRAVTGAAATTVSCMMR